MDIDYHTAGEDIITANNNVNQTHHVPVQPIIINESYDINKAKLEDEAQQFS